MLKIKDDYFIHEESRTSWKYFHFENITSIIFSGNRFTTEKEWEEASARISGLWRSLEQHRICLRSYNEIIGTLEYDLTDLSTCETDYENLINAHAKYYSKVKNEEKEKPMIDCCPWVAAECNQVGKAFIFGAKMQRKYCVGADCTALTCDGCKHIIDSVDYINRMRNKK